MKTILEKSAIRASEQVERTAQVREQCMRMSEQLEYMLARSIQAKEEAEAILAQAKEMSQWLADLGHERESASLLLSFELRYFGS